MRNENQCDVNANIAPLTTILSSDNALMRNDVRG